jgi:hypothetical protein
MTIAKASQNPQTKPAAASTISAGYQTKVWIAISA